MSQLNPHHYTNELPGSLYTAAETRELDRISIEEEGIPGFELMSRAGCVAFKVLQETWPGAKRLLVFCGVGNNGGDGYIVASLAKSYGMSVTVVQVGDPTKLKNDALLAFGQAQAEQVSMTPFDADTVLAADVVVDALLGTGLSGEVRGLYRDAIAAINATGLPVLAVDIPSGLCADTGRILGAAVDASATVTFIGVKRGLLTGQAPEVCGEIFYGRIGVPDVVFARLPCSVESVVGARVLESFKPRPRTAHKGMNGHVLIVGGDLGMGGAVAMAAEAAGRSGAGLVSVITRPEHVSAILARRPEFMVLGCDEAANVEYALSKASVVVAGPGIGRGRWGAFLLEQVLESGLPVILDADGLNYLAAVAEQTPETATRGNWVLTPHPGEAARLLGVETAQVQQDRYLSVANMALRFNGVVLLKGAGTLVCREGDGANLSTRVITTGNPGMACGGMGDVLSGVIGALVAQGHNLFDATSFGAWIHGRAADLAVLQGGGERGLLATDLMPHLHDLVNPAKTKGLSK
ncbi:MAG: NAD(P)H-hydrate dehydratase [Pseudomonadales bacterium]|nr:NAD(P)H-hydrate dehydratase [Pseudomonadales bacterium]